MDVVREIENGVALIQAGQSSLGVSVLHSVLANDPKNIEALVWIGTVKHLNGDYQAAVDYFEEAIENGGANFTLYTKLGATLMAMGLLGEAEQAYRLAEAVNPEDDADYVNDNAPARTSIGHFEALIAQGKARPDVYIHLSNIHFEAGDKAKALMVLRDAEQRFPNDLNVQYCREKVAQSTIPGWHLPMLSDQARNDAFQRAIDATVKPGDVVLDIGTGSGLLAMMAVRAGADHVYAIEKEEALATVAAEIIALNGFADKITVLNKPSQALVIGHDLPQKADVLVAEIFDHALVGEGALPTLRHATKELLKEDARIVPGRGVLHGVIIECPHLHGFHTVDTVNGFDLSPLNVFANTLSYKDTRLLLNDAGPHRCLTKPFVVADFDFHAPPLGKAVWRTEVDVIAEGTGDAVLMWFDLELCDGVSFSTRDSGAENHWRQPTQMLLDHPKLIPGQSLEMEVSYETYFHFNVLGD